MPGSSDPIIMAMEDAMRERQERMRLKARLDDAVRVLRRHRYGGVGHCIECGRGIEEACTDTCEIRRALDKV